MRNSNGCISLMLPLRGGNWNNGSNAGLFALNLNNERSNSNSNIGFRPDCITLVEAFIVRIKRCMLYRVEIRPVSLIKDKVSAGLIGAISFILTISHKLKWDKYGKSI